MRSLGNLGFRMMLTLAFLFTAAYALTTPNASAQDAPASLTINVYTCDDLHDPIDPNQTLLDECALGTEDILFSLTPMAPSSGATSASTGSGGKPATISFSNLASGDFRLQQTTPETVALSYVATCTSNVRSFDYPFSPFAIIEPQGRLNIQLLPGEQLTCDWYNILAPEQETSNTLTVTIYSCNGDIIDPELCDRAADVDLRLFSPSAELRITSGANGIATFDGAGTYQIEPVSILEDRVFCGFHTDTGEQVDSLTLDPANPLTVDAYYCYPGA
jgi:hypothetical protein